MPTSRHKNSIIALATLGVYVGVLMAGASPVLGHAATTRIFDIKDEAEIVDDLDNNPDDGRSPVTASVQIYFEDVENFLANLGRLSAKGKFDPAKDVFDVSNSTLLPCTDSNISGRYSPVRFESTSESSRPALEYFSRGMEYGYSLGDCLPNTAFNVDATESKFSFTLNALAFHVKVAVRKQSPQRALDLIRELENTIKPYKKPAASAIRSQIIEYTTFQAENDQVLVRTRLPRGSLAALLASGAK